MKSDELMRSRGSITGIDLFGGVTLAIGCTVTAAIWCLGLAVRAVRETAADVNETMRHRVGADTYLSHLGQGVVLLSHSMRYLCQTRLCAAHIRASLALQRMRSGHCSDGCHLCFSHCTLRAKKNSVPSMPRRRRLAISLL